MSKAYPQAAWRRIDELQRQLGYAEEVVAAARPVVREGKVTRWGEVLLASLARYDALGQDSAIETDPDE